ncbi:MAG: ADP-ribosylglycohydrolase family protein [Anaerovoracaceae bacterium]|jgi:ADP-ribosylglycohydrolase
MLGAIIGDIVGSRFEWNNYKGKDFEFFTPQCSPTDDSIMTLAVAKSILESDAGPGDVKGGLAEMAVRNMQGLGRRYPDAGYGGMFNRWLYEENPQPYNSFGNGAAMRVSPCGFAGRSLGEVTELSFEVTRVTHDHPEGIMGAEAVAAAIFLAREGKRKSEIKDYINYYYYPMDFTLDEIRDDYGFDVSCRGTVPPALMAFFEAGSFEDAVRNAISIGGDSDTLAAVTGGVAEAYFGIPDNIRSSAMEYLDEVETDILKKFEQAFQEV